jgi:hypothetical protein
MMTALSRDDLYSLEDYARVRPEFRQRVLEHKRNRQLALGPNATLYFEDRLTMQYQIQEMLRTERIFEAEGIQEELDAYNPLIPGGSDWKATFMLEYSDVEQRRIALEGLVGVEHRVWVQVAGHERVFAVADEDLERSTDEKTSAIHFMRFALTADMVAGLRDGAALAAGIDHQNAQIEVDPVPAAVRDSLLGDLA